MCSLLAVSLWSNGRVCVSHKEIVGSSTAIILKIILFLSLNSANGENLISAPHFKKVVLSESTELILVTVKILRLDGGGHIVLSILEF